MATDTAGFTVEYQVIDAEADGSPCDDCGDLVFFKARALEKRLVPEKKWKRILFLCASCENCQWWNKQ